MMPGTQFRLQHIHAHTYTFCFLIVLARTRLLGRFTTCLAQTTTASRLLFALGWHFMPRECEFFFEIFEFKIFKNFAPS